MRTIGVVTVSRSDYGIYLPILKRIQGDPGLTLHLFVAGMHLSPEFGLTVRAIEADGFEISDRIEMLLSSDTPEGIAKSTGLGVIGFGQAYARFRPDILLVLGDRFEMLAAVIAALPYKLPVAHIHGGESTEGVIDESIRHSITKMSHLHFVSTELHRRRVIQMGEEPLRTVLTGAPSLDNLRTLCVLNLKELEQRYGLDLSRPTLLVTYHPVTLEYESTEVQVRELLAALDDLSFNVIFTYPNADTSGRQIIGAIRDFAARHPECQVVSNLGSEAYFSLMTYVAAMVGNSSSGIIEAASLNVPVVNIGNRQRGRVHGDNVISVECNRDEIVKAIETAVSVQFRSGFRGLVNPYGNGHASERIVGALRGTRIDDELLLKRFNDMDVAN